MTDFYVRTDGNDSNDGLTDSSGGAWLTIQNALDTVSSGDTVTIGDGVFNEDLLTVTSGTEGNPITLRAQNSRQATINSIDISHAYLTLDGLTWAGVSRTFKGCIELKTGGDNFIATDCLFEDTPIQTFAINWDDSDVDDCLISNCEVDGNHYKAIILDGDRNIVEDCIFDNRGQGADVFNIFGEDNIIRRNTFRNWRNDPQASGVLIVGKLYQWADISGTPDFSNVGAGAGPYTLNDTFTATGTTPTDWGDAELISGTHSDLFQTFSGRAKSRNIIIERNVTMDCEGVQIGNLQEDTETDTYGDWTFRNNIFVGCNTVSIYLPGMVWYGNVFHQCGQNSGSVLLFRTSATKGHGHDGTVQNNIFSECGSSSDDVRYGWYDVSESDGAITGLAGDYNLVVGTGAGTVKDSSWTDYGEGNGINGSDPLFTNAATGDFTLQVGSPAIGAGTILPGLTFDGLTRSSPTDIGAYDTTPATGTLITISGTLTIGP